jgi:hypothetical protein
VLALGLEQEELRSFLPFPIETKKEEYIASYFAANVNGSPLAAIGPADVHNRDPRILPLISAGAELIGNGVLARIKNANVLLCSLVPWQFHHRKSMNVKRSFRHVSFVITRLLANMGGECAAPVVPRFANPAKPGDRRWLEGLYLDVPEEWDDPYRFFRW